MQNLNLVEKLTLLALDDEKGVLVIDSSYLYFGLAGAVVLELVLHDRITTPSDDGNKSVIDDPTHIGDPVLDDALARISSEKKEKTIADWIFSFSWRADLIKRKVLDNLVEKGILEKEQGKVLWLFPHNRYPTQDSSAENEVRRRIREVVLKGAEPTESETMLLGLIKASKLQNEVFSKKDDHKLIDYRIETITAADKVSHRVEEIILATQAALAASY